MKFSRQPVRLRQYRVEGIRRGQYLASNIKGTRLSACRQSTLLIGHAVEMFAGSPEVRLITPSVLINTSTSQMRDMSLPPNLSE